MKEINIKEEIQKAENYLNLLKKIDEKTATDSNWFNLGEYYRTGDGAYQDDEKAFYCYKKAEFDCYNAKLAIAQCYLYGRGVEQDYSLAVNYFKQLDEGPEACYFLGICYEKGWGVQQDYRTAFQYYSKWGRPDTNEALRKANFKIAEFYKNGWGVAKSEQKALRIYLEDAIYFIKRGGEGKKGKKAILELTDYKKLIEEELKKLSEEVANLYISTKEYEERKKFLQDLLK